MLEQVLLVKDDEPIPKDVVKAAENVSGLSITDNHGYCAIKAEDVINYMSDNDSYKLIVPYLIQFHEELSGSRSTLQIN
jgi:hypothetical protein